MKTALPAAVALVALALAGCGQSAASTPKPAAGISCQAGERLAHPGLTVAQVNTLCGITSPAPKMTPAAATAAPAGSVPVLHAGKTVTISMPIGAGTAGQQQADTETWTLHSVTLETPSSTSGTAWRLILAEGAIGDG